MFDWGMFTLYLYILMRISGFILFSPIFARNGVPTYFQAGFIGLLSMVVLLMYDGTAVMPDMLIVFVVKLLAELSVGLFFGLVMRFFFFIAEQGGEIVDTQMGLSMARMYDPSTQTQLTVTANMYNSMMLLLFFAENGHITLLRMMLTSGEIVPFGHVALPAGQLYRLTELFAHCALLSVKLAFPILGAELMGQIGMGILNKVIPQINVFVINIDLKILIGFGMLLILVTPASSFLLEAESDMLHELRTVLGMMREP